MGLEKSKKMFKRISRKACLHRLRVARLRHRYSFSVRGRRSKAGRPVRKVQNPQKCRGIAN